jgi:hypothetical protein
MAEGDAYLLTALGDWNGERIENDYCVIEGASPTIRLEEWANFFFAMMYGGFVQPGMSLLLHNRYRLRFCSFRKLPLDRGGGSVAFELVTPEEGVIDATLILLGWILSPTDFRGLLARVFTAIGADPLPIECAIVANLVAGPGRRRRGRKFFGPLSRTVMDDNGLLTPYAFNIFQNTMRALVQHFGDPTKSLAAVGWGWAVWSVHDSTAFSVTSVSMSPQIYTRNTRKLTRGI